MQICKKGGVLRGRGMECKILDMSAFLNLCKCCGRFRVCEMMKGEGVVDCCV